MLNRFCLYHHREEECSVDLKTGCTIIKNQAYGRKSCNISAHIWYSVVSVYTCLTVPINDTEHVCHTPKMHFLCPLQWVETLLAHISDQVSCFRPVSTFPVAYNFK